MAQQSPNVTYSVQQLVSYQSANLNIPWNAHSEIPRNLRLNDNQNTQFTQSLEAMFRRRCSTPWISKPTTSIEDQSLRTLIGSLNKLSISNFTKISSFIINITKPLTSPMIDIILNHALLSIKQFVFSNPFLSLQYKCLYSKLCNLIVSNQSDSSSITNMITIRMQHIFEQNMNDTYTLYATMVLMACLYTQSLIDIKFIDQVIFRPLLNTCTQHTHNIIAMCIMLRHCASKIDTEDSGLLDEYLRELEIASKTLTFRIKFKVDELSEFRSNGWRTRFEVQYVTESEVLLPSTPSETVGVQSGGHFYCTLCSVSITSNKNYQDHLKGKKHRARCIGLESKQDELFCKLCSVTAPNKKSLQQHLNGKKHRVKAGKIFDEWLDNKDLCRKRFEEWLCNTVGLKEYLVTFRENEYDDITMIEFMDKDVIKNELGISNEMDFKLIMKGIEEFKKMISEFDAFLDKYKALKQCKDLLKKYGILTVADLKNVIQDKQGITRTLNITDTTEIERVWNSINGHLLIKEPCPDNKT